jgi:hypothetical protein
MLAEVRKGAAMLEQVPHDQPHWMWIFPAISALGAVLGGAIGAFISNMVWSRQQHWVLRRDTALDIMRSFGTLLEKTLILFSIALEKKHAALDEDKRKIVDEKYEANYINYSSAMTTHWQLQEISKLVFSMEVFERMEAVKNSFRALLAEGIEREGNVSHKFNDNFKLLKANQEDLSRRIKAELKI